MLIFAAGLALVAGWRSSAPRPVAHATVRPTVAPVRWAHHVSPAPTTIQPRPPSLAGSAVDGELGVDRDGRFRPTAGAIRLFDYFLATLGETDVAGVRVLVAGEARRRLPGQEADVLALFDAYVAYLGALSDEVQALAPREALERVVAIQEARFGAEQAATLFGEATQLALVILDEAEAGFPSAELEARLPEATQRARAAVRAPAEVRAQVAAVRARGGSDAEVWRLRAARFGPDAADRLAELDRAR
jgi:lipase chaperone LimK